MESRHDRPTGRLGVDGASYRTVTSRDCAKRGPFGLLFSSFGFTGKPAALGSGIHVTETGHPGEVEVIAFDDVDGVFNFYKEFDGAMHFFGSSLDFTVAGPGGPSLTSTRGCANCHPGGGLNMKELESPWTHWALPDHITGADVLVANRASYLGALAQAIDMQVSVTQPGNDRWNEAKARFLSTATTADLDTIRARLVDDPMTADDQADLARRQLKKRLHATQTMLEPLFCAVQVNINSVDRTLGGVALMPTEIFATVRNRLPFPSPAIRFGGLLDAALAAIASRVPGVGGTELTSPLMQVTRSHEDESYVDQLVALGVIDQGFVHDVMMVDFTRPALSDDRCRLLGLIPDLDPVERKPDQIRDAVISAIEASGPDLGSPAAQLLRHLKARQAGTPSNHFNTLSAYATACRSRDSAAMLRDVLKMRSLQRQVVYADDGN
jgi:hypothetical protein